TSARRPRNEASRFIAPTMPGPALRGQRFHDRGARSVQSRPPPGGPEALDVFQKCRDYRQARDLRAADLYSYYRPLASAQDPEVTMADGRKLVMLGSNNYLGPTN